MSEPIRFRVEPGEAGRADAVVGKRFPNAGRRRIAALFRDRLVTVDGRPVKKGQPVAAGSEVELSRPPTTDADLTAVPDPELATTLQIVFEDDAMVCVNKPAGVPSQPLRPGERGCAANALVARYPECADVADDPREAGLVHRLDIGTSGLLVCARRRPAWEALRRAFAAGDVHKTYLALVHGTPGTGASDSPLAQRGRRAVVDYAGGLPAHTEWRTLERRGETTLVECTATSGRMHQVRAHLAEAGTPIAGDTLYGGPSTGEPGFCLHAARLVLPHPRTSQRLELEAPPPDWATRS